MPFCSHVGLQTRLSSAHPPDPVELKTTQVDPWDPKMPQEPPKTPPRPPKTTKDPLKMPQDAPKTVEDAGKMPPNDPKSSQDAPKTPFLPLSFFPFVLSFFRFLALALALAFSLSFSLSVVSLLFALCSLFSLFSSLPLLPNCGGELPYGGPLERSWGLSGGLGELLVSPSPSAGLGGADSDFPSFLFGTLIC